MFNVCSTQECFWNGFITRTTKMIESVTNIDCWLFSKARKDFFNFIQNFEAQNRNFTFSTSIMKKGWNGIWNNLNKLQYEDLLYLKRHQHIIKTQMFQNEFLMLFLIWNWLFQVCFRIFSNSVGEFFKVLETGCFICNSWAVFVSQIGTSPFFTEVPSRFRSNFRSKFNSGRFRFGICLNQ